MKFKNQNNARTNKWAGPIYQTALAERFRSCYERELGNPGVTPAISTFQPSIKP
jgi:hypothetical protein